MKITPAAVAFAIVLAAPSLVAAQGEAPTCVDGAFSLEFVGSCNAASVVAAYSDQVFDAVGARSAACAVDAAADLAAKLAAAGLPDAAALCDTVYAAQDQVPFANAARRGKDLRFEQEFFNGRTDWQEEVETIYETEDMTATSHLQEDAEQVRVFYDGVAQGRRVDWPGSLTNFQSSVNDADDMATCTTNAAMCCWPKDRQANDNNGNCNRNTYDENCVDKDPADNTDLCFVDPARGNASTGFDSTDGLLVYPGDNNDGEGAIHCHGLAWSNDVNDHTARYKANNLFFVSMYDHMYQRGYVQNIPGAPMCGCVEQMPTVSRSDCTQVDLTETVRITYDPDATPPFQSELTHVHVDFNACQGINNRNNDLWAYIAKLYYQGDVTPEQFGEAGRIITDSDCSEATAYHLSTLGLARGYDHDVTTWTLVAGRDELRLRDHHGRRAFARSLAPPAGDGTDLYGIVYRACATCLKIHQKIFYRRVTPVPETFDLLHNILYGNNDGGGQNVWNQDFTLHSTHEDALAGVSPWLCPNNAFDYNYNFYGQCSPDGTRVSTERSRFNYDHDKKSVAYFTNKAEVDGFEEVPTAAVRGRGAARGVALRDPVDGSIYMTGAGYDIHWIKDDFNFLSEPATGDRTVVVRAGSMSNPQPHQWSKAGIMLRASMDPEATHYSVLLTESRGVCPIWRPTKGAHAQSASCVNSGTSAAWLKVEKRADTYTSFVGTQEDETAPVVWTLVNAQEIPAIAEANTYHAGLAVASLRYYAMEVIFQHYQVDTYYFPSAAPSLSSAPTVDEPQNVIGDNAEATQDSTCYGGNASRAIDGNREGNWGHGSVMHTCTSSNPWWQVDLGREETHITDVAVYHRTDCCWDRVANTDLEILDADGDVVARQPFVGEHTMHYFRFRNVVGRYVKLNRKESGVLNIAEVEVFGTYVAPSAAPSLSFPPTVDEPRNLITAKAVASQDTICWGGSPARAIDGNKDGNWGAGSVQHTCTVPNAWWKVDFGTDEDVHITSVLVYNRSDCCNTRLRDTVLQILDADGDVVEKQSFEGDQDVYHFTFPNVEGRSVRVYKNVRGELNIAEVEVFGW